jgi:glycosyltransferase involved in cell wall biosynthesis
MKKPVVSLVTVCYNSEKTIERTIQSVLNQTYPLIQYIIIDGASTDQTMEIINGYRKDFGERLMVVSEPDNGIYDAMNKGINLCSGEYVGIINSDDWYENDAVEKIVKAFKKQKCDLVYGAMRYWKDEFLYSIKYISHEFLEENMINHPTCFVKRSLYLRYGGFDTNYKIAADYDLILRFKKREIVFYGLEEILTNFTYGGASNREDGYQAYKERDKIWLEYNIISKTKWLLKNMSYNFKTIVKRTTRV